MGVGSATKVLDIGCGCGGLGLALAEQFAVRDYTGLEINAQAAATGRTLNPTVRILEGDLLALDNAALSADGFDVVVSLSCIDWNVGFGAMLPKAFACVRPGGALVLSLRLSDGPILDDPVGSYQYINFAGELKGEKASYVVLNSHDGGFGFWAGPATRR